MTEPATTRQLGLPLPQAVACTVCGNPLEVIRRRGRPQKFCGDHCRRSQMLAQQAAWHARKKSAGAEMSEEVRDGTGGDATRDFSWVSRKIFLGGDDGTA